MPPLSFTLNDSHKNTGTVFSAVPQGGTGSKRRIPAGCVHGGPDSAGEVMRLTALLDDARTKLERTNTKLAASETSVCRANNALVSERATANARMTVVTNENTMLKDTEFKLRTALKNNPLGTEAVHADTFRTQAEGAMQTATRNEDLCTALDKKEKGLVKATEELQTLSLAHAALQASYNQIASDLGTAVANHEAELSRITDEARRAPVAAQHVDTGALVACQKAADARLAAELAAAENNSKQAMRLAVSAAIDQTREEMRTGLEVKLEATEKRNADTEKTMYVKLERAFEERDAAQALAAKHECRARLAEEFVGAVAPPKAAPTEAPTEALAESCPMRVNADVEDANNETVCMYADRRQRLESHTMALKKDPHNIRKQMRTAAVARECRDISNAMLFAKTAASPRYATADRDTGSGYSSTSQSVNEDTRSLITNAYPTCFSPYAHDDMGGDMLVTAVHTASYNDTVKMAHTQQARVDALIDATQQDLSKSLAYQTLVHKRSAGIISSIVVDSTGHSTAGIYEPGDETEAADPEPADLIAL